MVLGASAGGGREDLDGGLADLGFRCFFRGAFAGGGVSRGDS